jgi:hypothetical protein
MPSDWKELLVASRIDDLRRQAEHERVASQARRRRDRAAGLAWSVRGSVWVALTQAVRALFRRPPTCEGSIPLREEGSRS